MYDFSSQTLCNTGSKKAEHPGAFLARCYLTPMKITQSHLAAELKISRRRVNEIVQGRRAISADTALRLAIFLKTPAMFWLDKQQRWDLYQAQKSARGNKLSIKKQK